MATDDVDDDDDERHSKLIIYFLFGLILISAYRALLFLLLMIQSIGKHPNIQTTKQYPTNLIINFIGILRCSVFLMMIPQVIRK